MPLGKKWSFLLYHNLHPHFLHTVLYSLGRKRLVGAILKCFGHLNSIFSFTSTNQSNSITYVLLRKLRRTTTRSFFDIRVMSGAQSRDRSNRNPSLRGYVISRMTRIKQRKNVSTLSSRDWFHYDGGMVQVVVMTCLAMLNNHMMYILYLEPIII